MADISHIRAGRGAVCTMATMKVVEMNQDAKVAMGQCLQWLKQPGIWKKFNDRIERCEDGHGLARKANDFVMSFTKGIASQALEAGDSQLVLDTLANLAVVGLHQTQTGILCATTQPSCPIPR